MKLLVEELRLFEATFLLPDKLSLLEVDRLAFLRYHIFLFFELLLPLALLFPLLLKRNHIIIGFLQLDGLLLIAHSLLQIKFGSKGILGCLLCPDFPLQVANLGLLYAL